MASSAITVSAAAVSHVGCVRTNNEDNFFIEGSYMPLKDMDAGDFVTTSHRAAFHLFAVCDGMGGLNGGEFASFTAAEAIRQLYTGSKAGPWRERLHGFVREASQKVLDDGKKRQVKSSGSTLALLLLDGGAAHVSNVGDSRVYMLRLGKLVQISNDHTAVFQQMQRGEITREQMRLHPKGNAIYQYLGMPSHKIADDYGYYRACSLCNGDRFLICSDGISDLLPHEQIEAIVASHAQPEDVAQELVMRANEMGGKDNMTCIVGDISAPGLPIQTPADLSLLSAFNASPVTMERTE